MKRKSITLISHVSWFCFFLIRETSETLWKSRRVKNVFLFLGTLISPERLVVRSISWWVCRGSWYCSLFGDNTETLFKREGKNRSGLHPSAVFTEFPARLNIRKGPEYRKPPGGIFLKRRGLHKLGPHQRSALGSGASFHALSITQVTAFKKRPVRRMRGDTKTTGTKRGVKKTTR